MSPLPLILAESAPDTTLTIAVVGGILAALQIAGMVFRKRGESDPMVAQIDAKLDALSDKMSVASARMDHLNSDFKEAVMISTTERMRQDDRIEKLDEAIRGNGEPGLKQDVGKIFLELERMEEQIKRLDARMADRRGKGRDHDGG